MRIDVEIKDLKRKVNILSKIMLTLYRSGVTMMLDKEEAAEIDRLVSDLVAAYGGDPRTRK